jgi:hypothetical protein
MYIPLSIPRGYLKSLKLPKGWSIRSDKSQDDSQYNGQKKNIRKTNNWLQNTAHKTKDWVKYLIYKRLKIIVFNNLTHISFFVLYGFFVFLQLDRILVGFITTYAISAYHHWCYEFESRSRRGVQHYVIKLVSDMRQVGGFRRVLWFPQPINLTATL